MVAQNAEYFWFYCSQRWAFHFPFHINETGNCLASLSERYSSTALANLLYSFNHIRASLLFWYSGFWSPSRSISAIIVHDSFFSLSLFINVQEPRLGNILQSPETTNTESPNLKDHVIYLCSWLIIYYSYNDYLFKHLLSIILISKHLISFWRLPLIFWFLFSSFCLRNFYNFWSYLCFLWYKESIYTVLPASYNVVLRT